MKTAALIFVSLVLLAVLYTEAARYSGSLFTEDRPPIVEMEG